MIRISQSIVCHLWNLPMRLIGLFVCAALCSAAPTFAANGEQVVNVYNWTDYIAPKVLKQFQKEILTNLNLCRL